jgi:hypothetical protein
MCITHSPGDGKTVGTGIDVEFIDMDFFFSFDMCYHDELYANVIFNTAFYLTNHIM